MTRTDALHILHAASLADLFPGAVVRDANETGSDEDRDEVDAAAHFLGLTVEESADGEWVIADDLVGRHLDRDGVVLAVDMEQPFPALVAWDGGIRTHESLRRVRQLLAD